MLNNLPGRLAGCLYRIGRDRRGGRLQQPFALFPGRRRFFSLHDRRRFLPPQANLLHQMRERNIRL